MRRKLISTFLALVGISIIGFSFLYFIGMYKEQDSGVLIESEPISKVYINGNEVGTTPYEANLNPGETTIKIKPQNIEGFVFDDYETRVNLVSGIRTIIRRDFKETDDKSSGYVVSFEKVGVSDSFVTVVSAPIRTQVKVDDRYYGDTPLRIKVAPGDHKLTISAENYIEKTLSIKVYNGYKLTASVKLASLELEVIETAQSEEIVKDKDQIKIDKTDVGFLRVRSGASVGFPEVGQVKPGEIYDVLEEGEHGKWFKIKFGDVEGWVSGEFVTKI